MGSSGKQARAAAGGGFFRSFAPCGRVRALVVEDDPASRRHAQRLLEAMGYLVETAAEAATARSFIDERRYDLVVVDFVLPDADGLQLLREWREAGHSFPVLALTGADSDAVVEGFLRAGAHDVIEKSRLDGETLRLALEGLASPSPFPPPTARPRPPADETRDEARDDAPGQGAATGPAVPALVRPGRALVVDDVAAARRLAVNLLERDGWRVDEATTAEDGLIRAVEGQYDVILVDQYLPDVEGVGLLLELRRRDVSTPVIALTGHGDERLATEFLLGGAVDFIPKDALNAARLRDALAAAAAVAQGLATRPE